MKRCVFLCEVSKGSHNTGVSVDESTIKIGKAEEGLDFLEIAGGWPVADYFGFGRVHSDSFGGDDEAEVLGGVGVEVAFFGFGVKVMVSEAFQD